MYFMFWEERDVKMVQKYIFNFFLTEIGNRALTEVTLGGQSVKF